MSDLSREARERAENNFRYLDSRSIWNVSDARLRACSTTCVALADALDAAEEALREIADPCETISYAKFRAGHALREMGAE